MMPSSLNLSAMNSDVTGLTRIDGHDDAIIGFTKAEPRRLIYDGDLILKAIRVAKRCSEATAERIFEKDYIEKYVGPFQPVIVFPAVPDVDAVLVNDNFRN